jgi:exoribonuclease R
MPCHAVCVHFYKHALCKQLYHNNFVYAINYTLRKQQVPKIRIQTRQRAALDGKRIVVGIDSWPANCRCLNFAIAYILQFTATFER